MEDAAKGRQYWASYEWRRAPLVTLWFGESGLEAFRDRLRGPLLLAGDAGYDEARTVFNALIDHRPGPIPRCAGTADVIAAVEFAREHDLLVSIKGGGHGIAGKAVYDGTPMIARRA